jgi:hypothetical protein
MDTQRRKRLLSYPLQVLREDISPGQTYVAVCFKHNDVRGYKGGVLLVTPKWCLLRQGRNLILLQKNVEYEEVIFLREGDLRLSDISVDKGFAQSVMRRIEAAAYILQHHALTTRKIAGSVWRFTPCSHGKLTLTKMIVQRGRNAPHHSEANTHFLLPCHGQVVEAFLQHDGFCAMADCLS